MTLDELAAALDPIARCAVDEPADLDVVKVSIVLGALLGAIAGGSPPDRAVLNELAVHAGLICEHRAGKHQRS